MEKATRILIFLIIIGFFIGVSIVPINGSLESFNNKSDCIQKSVKLNSSIINKTYFCGCLPEPDDYWLKPELTYEIGEIPKEWDWRNAEINGTIGDWTSTVKEQGSCGSCWAFAPLGALESIINIMEEDPDLDLDLSEQYLLSCSDAGSCNGGYSLEAIRWIEQNGMIIESCFPYKADDTISCSEKCDNWMDYRISIGDNDGDGMTYGYWNKPSSDFIKGILIEKGPLIVRMYVYNDFYQYTGGIYRKIVGITSENHVVLLVGYNDTPDEDYGGYWICKNSWGDDWGEPNPYNPNSKGGWFRIAYNAASIGYNTIYLEYKSEGLSKIFVNAKFDIDNFKCTQDIVNFEGNAIGGLKPYSWLWNFGDGNFSNEKNTTHSYKKPGIYEVLLTVIDNDGRQGNDKNILIIEENKSNLKVNGNLRWDTNNINPGEIITNSFIIENTGCPESRLNWEISEYPNWGNWSFTQLSGNDLIPEADQDEIIINIIVPNNVNTDFTGNIRIENKEDIHDYEIIDVSLSTTKNKIINSLYLTFLENHPHLFPLIIQILKL